MQDDIRNTLHWIPRPLSSSSVVVESSSDSSVAVASPHALNIASGAPDEPSTSASPSADPSSSDSAPGGLTEPVRLAEHVAPSSPIQPTESWSFPLLDSPSLDQHSFSMEIEASGSSPGQLTPQVPHQGDRVHFRPKYLADYDTCYSTTAGEVPLIMSVIPLLLMSITLNLNLLSVLFL
ncbi:unnamed protein product [Linum trigynum]|uniref:Uncharacterized protein n=1 Tax=Linum trigynum TaxID=586398 RepID=A0AAV2FPX0_9ROSI